ncbi:MAG: InlB B-repeat-containing protein, partial [Clostridia bacterium]|nr:InlB B-repeat-containing protein [Clostridia bacterium]
GTAVSLPDGVKAQHDFGGWYTTATFDEGTKIESISATMTGNITLWARFTPISYTITYVLDGGENNVNNPDTYTVLDTTVLGNPTKTGYTFAGWYTDANFNNSISSLEGKSGNLTLRAKWTKNNSSGITTPEHTFGK